MSRRKGKHWKATPMPPGKMVDVNGQKFYLRDMGKGNLTIILEPTVGSYSPEWWHLQEELQKLARVVTYDRAGYGWSDSIRQPRTSENIANELKQVLEARNIKGPYLLVGHGQGAIFMQHFARMHASEVAGAVFVEPLALDYERFLTTITRDIAIKAGLDRFPSIQSIHLLNRLGIIRSLKGLMMKNQPLVYYGELKEDTQKALWEHFCQEVTPMVVRLEYMELMKQGNDVKVKKTGGFPNIPVEVIYPDSQVFINELTHYGVAKKDAEQVEQIYKQMAQQYLALSTDCQWVEAKGSSQFLHISESSLILERIHGMITKLKK